MSHLSTLNPLLLDPSRPTLFELVSAEQLSGLLSPSVRYVLAYFAVRHPRYLLKLVLYFDELYALLSSAIELRCLRTWNASLTESFYDLARRRVLKTDRAVVAASGHAPVVETKVATLARLRAKEIYGSLFCLVGVPYLQEKIERYIEGIQSRSLFRSHYATEAATTTRWGRIRAKLDMLLLTLYPSLKLGAGTITLLLNLLYLFGKSPYHSLTDVFLGIRYTRQSGSAFGQPPQVSAVTKGQTSRNWTHQIQSRMSRSFDIALSSILPTAVLSLKLLEWWQASDFPRQLSQSTRRHLRELQQARELESALETGEEDTKSDAAKYALDPPLKPKERGGSKMERSDICSLCGKVMKDPTVIETGTVFCYQCIYSYILNTPADAKAVRCPLTGQRLLGCRFDEISERWIASGLRKLVV
ncbi:Pex12 amino terminal region-domain-containing protein [Lipomyces kononenkoae]|uniref:Pex12 amino terminal region-domain-containing protein n=1 Tax=Lipomyces kononenkoae TaxID=34357 RepID=A0ACC3T0J5_LIPKO